MNIHSASPPAQRRFLVINFWIGSRDDGVLEGPVLVSTADYQRFHLWDEPYAATLAEDEYQIVKLYPRGLSFDDAAYRFAREYPMAVNVLPGEPPVAATSLWIDMFSSRLPRVALTA
jgi:hypothetical protein